MPLENDLRFELFLLFDSIDVISVRCVASVVSRRDRTTLPNIFHASVLSTSTKKMDFRVE